MSLFNILLFLVPLFHLAGFAAALHALLNVRTAQGAIAWCLSLVMFPYLALPLYAVFGRNRFYGYIGAIKAADTNRSGRTGQILKDYFSSGCEAGTGSEAQDRAWAGISGLPPSGGNSAELLIDGRQTFDSIFAALESATEYILIQFFIFRDDDLGGRLKELLKRKSASGVRVFLMYDAIGCFYMPSAWFDDLRSAGVSVASFGVLKKRRNRYQINFRNHRKTVVVDGKCAFVGGHNAGDEYLGLDPRFGRWRDTHLKVEGEIVKAVQLVFLNDWHWATSQIIDLRWQAAETHGKDGIKMLAVPGSPADSFERCTLLFLNAINSAKKRIWITSPYFVPNSSLIDALQLAALRGVDVRIMLPLKPDHPVVYLASFAYLFLSEMPGIKFFRYKAGFLHQKVFVVDDDIAAVGTANFDYRSFRLNFEMVLVGFSAKLASEVSAMLEEDFRHCKEVDITDYTQRNVFFRLAVRLARLFAPVL